MDILWQWDVMFKVLKVKTFSAKNSVKQSYLSKLMAKYIHFSIPHPQKELFAMNSDIQEKPKRGFQAKENKSRLQF